MADDRSNVGGDVQTAGTQPSDIRPAPPPGDGRDSDLGRLRAELNAAQLRLERLEQSSRRLISNISHELRTPITLIQGYIEGLLEGVIADPDKQRRSLEMIYAKVTGMNRLITDLFQLTVLQSGQVDFELRPVMVCSLKDHLKSRFELDVEQAGHRLRISATEIFYEQALAIRVDIDRLDQVFMNLLTNAFRYLPQEGGSIHIYLEFFDWDEEPQLLVRVKDNGSGIAEKDLPFIFDRFYTGDSPANAKQRRGVGLGLSICEEIVAAHGGSIYADSVPGRGAEFFFTIPIAAGTQIAGTDVEKSR